MRKALLLLAVVGFVAALASGCGENPCERAHKYVSECLNVTYTSDQQSRCLAPGTPEYDVAGGGCHCDGYNACASDCYFHTDCEWIVAASQGKSVPGLENCLRDCLAAN